MAAKFRVRVTPDFCTQCRLCEASCPFGAMREPDPGKPDATSLRLERLRLASLLVLVPLLIVGAGWLGARFSIPASRLHPSVALAETFLHERNTPPKTGALSPDDLALQRARQAPAELLSQASRIRNRFHTGGWLFGAWVGLVVGMKLVAVSVRRKRIDYEPDRGACVACARCFEYCPNELVRRGVLPGPTQPERLRTSATGISTATAGAERTGI
jgi:ferredoxin